VGGGEGGRGGGRSPGPVQIVGAEVASRVDDPQVSEQQTIRADRYADARKVEAEGGIRRQPDRSLALSDSQRVSPEDPLVRDFTVQQRAEASRIDRAVMRAVGLEPHLGVIERDGAVDLLAERVDRSLQI
jgi:hypothetical protein